MEEPSQLVNDEDYPKPTRFYTRHDWALDSPPNIFGQPARLNRRCRLCTIARNLFSREENPLPLANAFWAEFDLAKMYALDYSHTEIREFLEFTYDYEVSNSTVQNHLKHIANPHLFKMQQYREMSSRGLDIEAFKNGLRLPYIVIDKAIELVNSGGKQVSIQDGMRALEFLMNLYEMTEREAEREEFMNALFDALEKSIPNAKSRQKVVEKLRSNLNKHRSSLAAIEGVKK